jgi:hypothetical protein
MWKIGDLFYHICGESGVLFEKILGNVVFYSKTTVEKSGGLFEKICGKTLIYSKISAGNR